ncbi:MAG: hypothetical protein KKI14_03065, partial [Nanoarchaeota archaeon]|nr:hypothetical protein [Nanoarchaeota archaeon]
KTAENARVLNSKISSINDPLDMFKLYNDIAEHGKKWNIMSRIGSKNENAKYIENVNKTVEECVKSAENRFIDLMSDWIKSTKTSEHKKDIEGAIEKVVSIKDEAIKPDKFFTFGGYSEMLPDQAKYNILYRIGGYSEMLPKMWQVYEDLLLEKKGKCLGTKNLKLLTNDINENYSKLHKAIFDKNADVAYA